MTETNNLGDFLQFARAMLVGKTDTPGIDSQVLAAHGIGKDRAWVLGHPEYRLAPSEKQFLMNGIERMVAGYPLPYIIQNKEFFGLDFFVTPDVLIPRPETELLVEHALAWCQTVDHEIKAVDIGTGSGCIAISLAKNLSHLQMIGVDISAKALRVAYRNAQHQDVMDSVGFVQMNLVDGLCGKFDLACANLPYIPTQTLHQYEVSKYEPVLALDGGKSGIRLINKLLESLGRVINRRGLILLEIQSDQSEPVTALASELFPNSQIETIRDLADLPRLIKIELNG